ncbi:MAG TPA: c-type cytochrome domain-containing protein, partial [Planctomycetaceae bacterium]|nr:c-type cytochrome domain-containing protein [Planctomycetaceae bacterium]
MPRLSMLCLMLGMISVAGRAECAEPTAEQLKFFETSVRPLLVEHCQKCHGEKKQWGALRLDSHEALLKGGENGPAIVPGKPEESRLIQAVRHSDDLQMPPDEK